MEPDPLHGPRRRGTARLLSDYGRLEVEELVEVLKKQTMLNQIGHVPQQGLQLGQTGLKGLEIHDHGPYPDLLVKRRNRDCTQTNSATVARLCPRKSATARCRNAPTCPPHRASLSSR